MPLQRFARCWVKWDEIRADCNAEGTVQGKAITGRRGTVHPTGAFTAQESVLTGLVITRARKIAPLLAASPVPHYGPVRALLRA